MEKNYKNQLFGKWVKFRIGRKNHYGKVSSIEQDIVNIKGIEQRKKTRPAYHYNFQKVRICSQDEVFKIGRSIMSLIN